MPTYHQPDTFQPIAESELTDIIGDHDRLKAWNDLNDQALSAASNEPDHQVVKNIQATAALIMRQEKIIASQNFELMRAMNLFDKTLSAIDLAEGFAKGSLNALQDKARETFTFITPSDMNLKHSQARGDEVMNTPMKLAEAAREISQHPGMAAKAMQVQYQTQITETVFNLAASMSDTNPSEAVGAAIGVALSGMVINGLTPAGKGKMLTMSAEKVIAKPTNWHEYATLLGGGSYPPPLRSSRDFSDLMQIESYKFIKEKARVSYTPGKIHKIVADLYPGEGMSFLIKAKGNRDQHGSGTEMFLSMTKKLHENGIDIPSIKASWQEGELGANWQQFMEAYHAGATPTQAFKQTFTGRMAERLGLTSVDMKYPDWALATDSPTLKPVFKRPDWGKNPAWNDYANAWVLSQGRPGLEVISRGANEVVKKAPPAIPEGILKQVETLPPAQRDGVLRQLEANFAKQATASGVSITRIDTPDAER